MQEVDFGSKYEQQTKALLARYDSLGVMNKPRELNDYVGGQSFCCGEKELVSNNQTGDNTFETPDYEQLIFFYHPDHLGSTSLVTDNSGNVVQSVAYIPYGEVFVEERNGTWNTPYLFNGKELDEETGLYYYGARYLNPTNGMWLSTDPLFEKYVGMSPYNYCAGNPVKLVDPDGRTWCLREVDGALEIYYDRKVRSQADADNLYKGKDVISMSNNTSLFGFTFINDDKDNKYGKVYDSSGNLITQNKPIQGVVGQKKVDIFCGTSDNSVDATTLHKNYMGTSYTGPNNPKDYKGNENYDYCPHNLSEMWSIIHDLDYNKKGARGVSGAFFDTSVIGADFKLAGLNLISLEVNNSYTDRMRSLGTTVAFTLIGTFKCLKSITYDPLYDSLQKVSDVIYNFNKNFNRNIINFYP